MVNTIDLIKEMKEYAEDNNVPIITDEGINYIRNYIKENKIKRILEVGTAIGYSSILMALTDEEIILLDNQIQDSEDYVEGDLSMDEDYEDEEEVIDKAEELAKHTKFDLENTQSFEKVKPKKSNKVYGE